MKQELCNEANHFGPGMPGRTVQQAGAARTGAKAPKETPPNNDGAARRQIIPPKDPPWNEWLRLARQGNEHAKLRFCTQAEPFIELFCRIRYFRRFLGEEEIRGIAALKVMEFLMEYPDPPEDKEIPVLLKRVIRNALLYPTEKAEVRSRREQRPATLQGDGEKDGEVNAIEGFPAKRREEPEAKLLSKELQNATAEAMQQLLPSEQNVIRALFFRNKTIAAIAKELQCTRQNVEQMRDRALRRLREFFEGQGFNSGAFCH